MPRSFNIVLFLLLVTCWVFEATTLDMAIQDRFYDVDVQQWLLDRDDKILKFFFYDMMKIFYALFMVAIAAILIFFRNRKYIEPYRKGLVIVLLSTLMVPLTIGALKAVTNTPCPRDITRFGGSYPYVTVFESYPDDFKTKGKVACFPAGHASGGFALMALFFLFKHPHNQKIVIAMAATTGWVMGAYKMLIGDHFLSHTLVSMELAWLVIILISCLVKPGYRNKTQVQFGRL